MNCNRIYELEKNYFFIQNDMKSLFFINVSHFYLILTLKKNTKNPKPDKKKPTTTRTSKNTTTPNKLNGS